MDAAARRGRSSRRGPAGNVMREELTWPAERLGEALEILGRRARLSAPRERVLNPDAQLDLGRSDKLGRWVEQTAAWLGFEAQSVYAHRREIGRLLGQSHPALFRIAGQEGPPRFVAMLRGGRRDAVLIGPDFVERTLAPRPGPDSGVRTDRGHDPRADRAAPRRRKGGRPAPHQRTRAPRRRATRPHADHGRLGARPGPARGDLGTGEVEGHSSPSRGFRRGRDRLLRTLARLVVADRARRARGTPRSRLADGLGPAALHAHSDAPAGRLVAGHRGRRPPAACSSSVFTMGRSGSTRARSAAAAQDSS